jgi:hypothetical protein
MFSCIFKTAVNNCALSRSTPILFSCLIKMDNLEKRNFLVFFKTIPQPEFIHFETFQITTLFHFFTFYVVSLIDLVL